MLKEPEVIIPFRNIGVKCLLLCAQVSSIRWKVSSVSFTFSVPSLSFHDKRGFQTR